MKIVGVNETLKLCKILLFLCPTWKFHESLNTEKLKYNANKPPALFFFFNQPLLPTQIWEPKLYDTILQRLTQKYTRRVFLFYNPQKIGNSKLYFHVVILLTLLALTLSPFPEIVLLFLPWFSFPSSLLLLFTLFAGSDEC